MSKPIVFIDASYLITFSRLGDLGGVILAKISANFEIHTTDIVLGELGTLSPSAQSWVNNTNNYIVDPSPVTESLLLDGAITTNAGDLSIYEAAKPYGGVTTLMDDGFAKRVIDGKSLLDFIENKQTESYQNIKDNFSDYFEKGAITERVTSFRSLVDYRDGIVDQVFWEAVKATSERVGYFAQEAGNLISRFLGDESGSVDLPDVGGAAAVRAFGQILGGVGLAVAAYDMVTSTQKSYGDSALN